MRLGYLMPLTVDNILTARKLSYDALEANVGWITDSSMAALQQAACKVLPQLGAVLVKGSRFMKMERVADAIVGEGRD